jgi:hypothetical protein
VAFEQARQVESLEQATDDGSSADLEHLKAATGRQGRQSKGRHGNLAVKGDNAQATLGERIKDIKDMIKNVGAGSEERQWTPPQHFLSVKSRIDKSKANG